MHDIDITFYSFHHSFQITGSYILIDHGSNYYPAVVSLEMFIIIIEMQDIPFIWI
jgi:hypothetical protein